MGFSLSSQIEDANKTYHAKMKVAAKINGKAEAIKKRVKKNGYRRDGDNFFTEYYLSYAAMVYHGKVDKATEIEVDTLEKAARDLAYNALFHNFTHDGRYIAFGDGKRVLIAMKPNGEIEKELYLIDDATDFDFRYDVNEGTYKATSKTYGEQTDILLMVCSLKYKNFKTIYDIYKALETDKDITRGKGVE